MFFFSDFKKKKRVFFFLKFFLSHGGRSRAHTGPQGTVPGWRTQRLLWSVPQAVFYCRLQRGQRAWWRRSWWPPAAVRDPNNDHLQHHAFAARCAVGHGGTFSKSADFCGGTRRAATVLRRALTCDTRRCDDDGIVRGRRLDYVTRGFQRWCCAPADPKAQDGHTEFSAAARGSLRAYEQQVG